MRIPRLPVQSSPFGLVAWLQHTRIALPLKGVECRFDVTGGIAGVEVDQIYHQDTDRPLDCVYMFPLPAGAAVYRCELHVNGRVIRAKVEAKETARRIFRDQKALGRRAALVEAERENLFTLSLGNIQPGDVVVVRVAWFQALDRVGPGMRLLVPTCPGVRYIPGKPLLRGSFGRGVADDTDQVPDASRITPPRIDALHPDAAYFSIKGRLSSADVGGGTASSPSHPVFVRERDGAVTVELSDRGEVPDRDFVLAWSEPKAKQLTPRAWRWTEGDETYAFVQLRAPKDVRVADDFAQDFYFLVDRSGSMSGAKWRRTCEALRAFVGGLGADDRVWITFFESEFRDFAEVPMPARAVFKDPGFRRMEALGADGGTELLPAAEHVLEQIAVHSKGNRVSVVLITDGQVGNDPEILRAFRQASAVRVHTFGIDTAVNDAFLKALARQNRGGCWLQTPNDDIAGTIAALGDRLRRPVLTEIAIGGSWEAACPSLPDLYAREVASVTVRGQATAPLEITGRLPDGSRHQFAVEFGTDGSEAIKLVWARERIAALLAADRQPEAIALARQHNLICEGAAFIAWDEAEQVPIAEDEVIQPAMEPFYAAAPTVMCLEEFPAALPSPLVRFAAANPSIRHEMRGFFQRIGDDGFVQQAVAEAREALQRVGAPEATVYTTVEWLRRGPRQAAARSSALARAMDLIAELRNDAASPMLRGLLETQIASALADSPESLLAWADNAWEAWRSLFGVHHTLEAAGTPSDVTELLLAWACETDPPGGERTEALEAFAEALGRLPFSAEADGSQWQTFVGSRIDANSEPHRIVTRWLETRAPRPGSAPAPRTGADHSHRGLAPRGG